MNQLLVTIAVLCASQLTLAQEQTNLHFNNVNATINTNAVLFYDTINNSSGYEVPKNTSLHAFQASSFWFGGLDVNGQLRLAAQKYASDVDFATGPLSTFGGGIGNYDPLINQPIDSIVRAYGDAEVSPNSMSQYNQIYTIEKSTIQDFIEWWNCDNGITPPSQCVGITAPNDLSAITNWPAHGDASLGQDYYLAPFYDNPNGPDGANGVYRPLIDGDYPCIPGHKAAYMILNDKGNIHSSGGEPIGLELHLMVYQYATGDFLNNTTFANLTIINRGTQTLYNFKAGQFTDPLIGDSQDDYIGTLPAKNLVYAYNADNDDLEYGINPPAIGVVLLNHQSSVMGLMDNQHANPDMAVPETAPEYWGYMNAEWGSSGVAFTEGGDGYSGTVPTNYLYTDLNAWSEIAEGNSAGNRQMFLTTDASTLSPGAMKTYEFAFIYAREGNHLQNVDSLFVIADSVQAFFDQQQPACPHLFDPILKVEDDLALENMVLHPNPTEGQFRINLTGQFDVKIYAVNGQLISEHYALGADQIIYGPDAPGIYLIQVHQNNRFITEKLMIK